MIIKVCNMSCAHCEAKIKKILKDSKIKAKVNLSKKEVEVKDCEVEIAKALISSLGYNILCE